MSVLKKRQRQIWLREINDLIRGACGGFLFGIPLLYTMEVWWIGSHTKPPIVLTVLLTTVGIVFWLTQTGGFRQSHRMRFSDALRDTVEALAIGLVCATLILMLLQEVSLDDPLRESLGKIVFEGIPFTLGVALANQFLGDTRDTDSTPSGNSNSGSAGSSKEKSGKQGESNNLNATLADISATVIGAIVIAFNIAPTDEIPMLSAAMSAPWLLAIMAASLLISYGIVFEAGFSDQQKRRQQQGIFQRPLSETVMSYLVSLLAAVLMLWFFQRLTLHDPWPMWLEQTLVLGLPATVGGAAGRLAI